MVHKAGFRNVIGCLSVACLEVLPGLRPRQNRLLTGSAANIDAAPVHHRVATIMSPSMSPAITAENWVYRQTLSTAS
jgi:hypothetical protein